MTKQSFGILNDDFEELLRFAKARGMLNRPTPQILRSLSRVHHAAFSLALWQNRLSNLPIEGRVFVSEIRSDAVQLIPLWLLGFQKPAALLLRGILENTLKHLYYTHHPVEFQWLVNDGREHPSIQELIGYFAKSEPFREHPMKDALVGEFSALYRDLSLDVHAHPLGRMEHRRSAHELKFKPETLGYLEKRTLRVARCANIALHIFHRTRFLGLGPESRRIVIRLLTPTQRRLLRASP